MKEVKSFWVHAAHNSDMRDFHEYTYRNKYWVSRFLQGSIAGGFVETRPTEKSFLHCLLWFHSPNIPRNNFWTLRCRSILSCLTETRTLRGDPCECVSVRIMWGNTSPSFVPNRFRAFYTENKWSCWLTGARAIRPYSWTFLILWDPPGWPVLVPGPG